MILDLAAYALADLWITLSKVAETRRKIDLLLFFLVPVLHLSYGLAEWAELFRPNKDLSEKSTAVCVIGAFSISWIPSGVPMSRSGPAAL